MRVGRGCEDTRAARSRNGSWRSSPTNSRRPPRWQLAKGASSLIIRATAAERLRWTPSTPGGRGIHPVCSQGQDSLLAMGFDPDSERATQPLQPEHSANSLTRSSPPNSPARLLTEFSITNPLISRRLDNRTPSRSGQTISFRQLLHQKPAFRGSHFFVYVRCRKLEQNFTHLIFMANLVVNPGPTLEEGCPRLQLPNRNPPLNAARQAVPQVVSGQRDGNALKVIGKRMDESLQLQGGLSKLDEFHEHVPVCHHVFDSVQLLKGRGWRGSQVLVAEECRSLLSTYL